MILNESFNISPKKLDLLRSKIKELQIDMNLVEEMFIKGGGKGGQKVNKTANTVVLKYPPLNLVVRCQKERQRSLNRFLALRELVDQIEIIVSPGTSARRKKWARLKKQKKRRQRRNHNRPRL